MHLKEPPVKSIVFFLIKKKCNVVYEIPHITQYKQNYKKFHRDP